MTERCAHCGEINCRVAHSYWLDGQEFKDDYCGLCGVNWGVRHKKYIPATRPLAKTLMKLFDKTTGRKVER